MKEEKENLGKQILQQTDGERAKQLSRFKRLRNKIKFLVKVLENSSKITAISIL